jgi:hypothetical protein
MFGGNPKGYNGTSDEEEEMIFEYDVDRERDIDFYEL